MNTAEQVKGNGNMASEEGHPENMRMTPRSNPGSEHSIPLLLNSPDGNNSFDSSSDSEDFINRLPGQIGQLLYTSTPISVSPEIVTQIGKFHNIVTPNELEGFSQTLRHIGSKLAEHTYPCNSWTESRYAWAWARRNSIPLHILHDWVKELRKIQDSLISATGIDDGHRDSLLRMSCDLQQKVFANIVRTPKPDWAVEGGVENVTTGTRGVSEPEWGYIFTKAKNWIQRNLGAQSTVWSGTLPNPHSRDTVYSSKVFLGGLPYGIDEKKVLEFCTGFGNVEQIEWPGKASALDHKGFVYVTFSDGASVHKLLQSCDPRQVQEGKWYFHFPQKEVALKRIEVIPWAISGNEFCLRPHASMDSRLTVFVGALHGILTAKGLAIVMHETFGGVVKARIDIDKKRYPIGSGQVIFDNCFSYLAAVNAEYLEIRTPKFSRTVQILPYLVDSICSYCKMEEGRLFCRQLICFRYYCGLCYGLVHEDPELRWHEPLIRPKKHEDTVPTPPHPNPGVRIQTAMPNPTPGGFHGGFTPNLRLTGGSKLSPLCPRVLQR